MKELKSKTMQVINNINNDWVEALELAEKEGSGLDLSKMFGKFSANIEKLDQYFREGEERVNKTKKKGFF